MTGPGLDPEPAASSTNDACPWCSAATPVAATHCPACGASLAERESLGGMEIPGVTEVDPGVIAAERRAAGIVRAKVSGADRAGFASTLVSGFVPGGPILGAAINLVATGLSHSEASSIGDPSSAALQLASKLDLEQSAAEGHRTVPSPDGEPDASAPAPDPWADLPTGVIETAPVANELITPLGAPRPNELSFLTSGANQDDPWAGASDPWTAGPAPNADPWATAGGPWSASPDGQSAGPWSTSPDPWATPATTEPSQDPSSTKPAPGRKNRGR